MESVYGVGLRVWLSGKKKVKTGGKVAGTEHGGNSLLPFQPPLFLKPACEVARRVGELLCCFLYLFSHI
jgi:hypothetical protein